MIVPRQYAMALIDPDGRLLGYVGSRPEWSALGVEMARKFASVAEAWIALLDDSGRRAGDPEPASMFTVVGLLTPGGDHAAR